MRIVLIFCLSLVASVGFAQEIIFSESFDGGSVDPDWYTIWEDGDIIAPLFDENAPGEDDWLGSQAVVSSGGGVGTSCNGSADLTDYRIDAWVNCAVTDAGTFGPYNGLIARADSTGGAHNFYVFRADFDDDNRLQLRWFPGTAGYGTDLLTWVGDAIPGGAPVESGWHQMGLEVIGDQIYAYWDGTLLPGCPVTDDHFATGYFGVYAFDMMNNNPTYFDDIVVTTVGSVVSDEPVSGLPDNFRIVSVYPNPFNPETTITFTSSELGAVRITAYDVLGREVNTIASGQYGVGTHRATWNANGLPAGNYFITLQADQAQDVKKVILLK